MKIYIDKQAAERCLTYLRKYLKESPTNNAYLDACTAASVEAVKSAPRINESVIFWAARDIREIAGLIARHNKPNGSFWAMLRCLDILPAADDLEEPLARPTQLPLTQTDEPRGRL